METSTKKTPKAGTLLSSRATHHYSVAGLDAWVGPESYRSTRNSCTPMYWKVQWREADGQLEKNGISQLMHTKVCRHFADARAFAKTLVGVAQTRDWSEN